MSEKIESLSKFGYDFQTKLIAILITDKTFLSQNYDIIKDSYFDSDSFKWVIRKCINYFNTYKSNPTLDYFKVELNDIDKPESKAEIRNILKDSFKNIESSDLDYIKDTTIEFCRNQELKHAILNSVDYIKAGKYDMIKTVIDKAFNVGQNTDMGTDYKCNVRKRYEESKRNPIPTGWNVINDLTKGGLGPGELGVVVGASGSGKSWLLMHIGAAAVKDGKKVLHVTLELDENYTGIRYDTILTGISSVNLALNIDKIERVVGTLSGELKIKWFPTKSLSMNGLKAYINKLKASGFIPDLLIVDYLDIMKLPVSSDNHLSLTAHYEEARGLAGEELIPFWSASQGNRESVNSDILEADKISGAYGKIFTADFAMSFSRKASDKITNTGRLHIIKNRFGPDGMTLPVAINTYQGTIEVFNESSDNGKEIKKTMLTEKEYSKQLLRNKYENLIKSPSF